MFIHIGIRKTRNTDDSLGSGTKLLLPSLSLGFQHDEKETQFLFCWLFHLTPQTHACAPHSNNWTGLAQTRISTHSVYIQISTHCFYSKPLRIPAHHFRAWRHSHPPVSFSILGFYCDICDCHILPMHAWTPALMSAPTHGLRRKVLSLTKPKDKIYKMKNDNIKKSFHNYITNIVNRLLNNIFHFKGFFNQEPSEKNSGF